MKSKFLKRRIPDNTLIKYHQISQSGPKHSLPLLSFVFGSRPVQSRPNGPHSLFLPLACLPAKLASSRKVSGGATYVACGCALRAISRLRANFFRAKFHHSALHYTHVPPSFRIAKMKFSFNFLLEIWLHTLMSIAITLHQIVLIILLYIRGHNFMVISDLITLHHIYATACIPLKLE